MTKNETYPIERASVNLLNELGSFVRSLGKYLFTVPKSKEAFTMWIIEFSAWILLTIALIMRWKVE
jgi:hypothetical protein